MLQSRHAQREEDEPQLLREAARLLGRADVRLGDELHEPGARAVEVHEAVRRAGDAPFGAADVDHLAGVLLEVDARDADAGRVAPSRRHAPRRRRGVLALPGAVPVDLDVEVPADAERQVVLRDLVVLRHVGIEVVLPMELAPAADVALERQAGQDGGLDRPSRSARAAAPGMPRHTGQTRVFGSPPNATGHPQNIFVLRLVSSVWISRPMTASHVASTSGRRSLDTLIPPGAFTRSYTVAILPDAAARCPLRTPGATATASAGDVQRGTSRPGVERAAARVHTSMRKRRADRTGHPGPALIHPRRRPMSAEEKKTPAPATTEEVPEVETTMGVDTAAQPVYEIERTALGSMEVDGKARVRESAVGMLAVKGDAKLKRGCAGAIMAEGDVSVTQSGVGLIMGRSVGVERSGGCVMVGSETTVQRGWVGLLLARKADISDDSRVLIDWKAALILSAVFLGLFGVVVVVMLLLARKASRAAAEFRSHLPHMPHMPEMPHMPDLSGLPAWAREHLRRSA